MLTRCYNTFYLAAHRLSRCNLNRCTRAVQFQTSFNPLREIRRTLRYYRFSSRALRAQSPEIRRLTSPGSGITSQNGIWPGCSHCEPPRLRGNFRQRPGRRCNKTATHTYTARAKQSLLSTRLLRGSVGNAEIPRALAANYFFTRKNTEPALCDHAELYYR